MAKITTFTLSILGDYQMGKWETNMPERSVWAREVGACIQICAEAVLNLIHGCQSGT